MAFSEAQRQWMQALFAGAGSPIAFDPPQPISSGGADDARPLLGSEGAAAGRDTMVNTQVDKLRGIAQDQPATPFDGDVYRAVPSDPNRVNSYADHSFSRGGRYNKMGDPALYTSPTVPDVQAEARNYGSPADPTGIEGSTIVRSEFKGDLLDARSLPDVDPAALEEPWGLKGQKRSTLSKLTGEDPYTMPRAVSDVAQSRNLGGVMAPANDGHTNIPLFPEKAPAAGDGALHDNLAYKAQQDVRGGVVQPETVSPSIKPNIPDVTPNRNANPALMAEDAGLHGRAGGARYGAAGAAAVTLAQDAWNGEFNAGELAENTAEGAAIGQADSMLSAQIAKNLAGAGAAEAEIAGVRAAAGMASAGAIGAVVGGGVAAWHDADKVKDGTMSAGDATADVAVSAGVGMGAGLAGAAAGAAIGSIIPVAGTAVGAVVGFGVGMAASVVVTLAAEKSGLADAAREELGEILTDNVEQPLQDAWHAASDASAAVQSAAGKAAGAVADEARTVATAASKAATTAVHDVEHAAEAAAKTAAAAAHQAQQAAAAAASAAAAAAENAAKQAAHAVEEAAAAAAETARSAAAAASKAASSAVDAVEDAAASLKKSIGSLF